MRKATALAVGLVASLIPAAAANASIIAVGGQTVLISPPPSVNFNQLQSDTQQFAFNEQQHVTLAAGLPVDITAPGTYDDESDLTPGTIPAGTVVNSQFVHCDNQSQKEHQQIEGFIQTDTDILGIAVLAPALDATDVLGVSGTDYPTGREQRRLNLDGQNDFVIEKIDARTVIVHCDTVSHVDQVRVLTVGKVASSTTTQVHDASHTDITGTSVPVGTSVHDFASVTGSGPAPTGTVTFSRFSTGDCSGSPDTTENVALSGGTAESSSFTPPAGALSYQAHYGGDANYFASDGACEPLTVVKLGSSTATQVHNASHTDITGTSVPAGTVVHDKAIVSGTGPTPTGSVTFTRYSTGDCTGSPASSETVSLSSGSAESSTFTTVVGSLSYSVHYGGDATYNPSDGPCEPLTVVKINSSTATQVHNASHVDITGTTVPAGTVVHDKATVTGSGPTPTGTVSFARYTNGTCYGSPAATQSGVALSGGSAESSTFTTVVGSLSYKVHYSGDGTYNASDGPCEPLTVSKLNSYTATQIHDYHHYDITGTTVAAGTSVHDKAIVTGSGPTPTGTVSFSRFTNGTCYGTPAYTQSGVSLSSGAAESSTFTTVQGSLSYRVHYSGDANYNASDGPCETLTVEKTGNCGYDDYYWRDYHHFSQWTDLHTTDSFEAVFGRDAFSGSPTLLQVLGYSGGGVAGLAREATAALLNARNPNIDYPLTSTQIINAFQAAFDSHNPYCIAQLICFLQQLNSHCGCGH